MPSATQVSEKAPTSRAFGIMLSVSDVAQLRQRYGEAFQWKKLFLAEMAIHHKEAVEILRQKSHVERVMLTSQDEFMQYEFFKAASSKLSEITEAIQALKALGLPTALTGRSAFFRAFGRMLLRGDFDSD